MVPRGAPEASRPSLGAFRAPSGSIFGDFSTLVSHAFRVMFFFVFACVFASIDGRSCLHDCSLSRRGQRVCGGMLGFNGNVLEGKWDFAYKSDVGAKKEGSGSPGDVKMYIFL